MFNVSGIGDQVAAALKGLPDLVHERFAHVLPPPYSQPIAWSAVPTVLGGDFEQWGVLWDSAPDSTAAGAVSNSFIVVTDSPAPGDPFPAGWRGAVWVDLFAGVGDTNPATVKLPKQVKFTLRLNGSNLPGYTRQCLAGDARMVGDVAGARPENGPNVAFTQTRCPILLRAGDRLGIDFDCTDGGLAGTNVDIYCHVRGWRWPAAELR